MDVHVEGFGAEHGDLFVAKEKGAAYRAARLLRFDELRDQTVDVGVRLIRRAGVDVNAGIERIVLEVAQIAAETGKGAANDQHVVHQKSGGRGGRGRIDSFRYDIFTGKVGHEHLGERLLRRRWIER